MAEDVQYKVQSAVSNNAAEHWRKSLVKPMLFIPGNVPPSSHRKHYGRHQGRYNPVVIPLENGDSRREL